MTGRIGGLADRVSTPWMLRTATALVAGVAMYGAFPPRTLWFLAVISLGLLAGLLGYDRPGARTGAWIGFVYGLAFFLPLIPWIGVYVGPVPWIALSVVLALYLALFGAIATITMRLPIPPIWFTLSWILVEWVRSSFPFGGFPWGRTAFSQADGPLLPLASILGAPGLSAAVALLGSSVMWLLVMIVDRVRDGRTVDDADQAPARRFAVRWAVVAVILALAAPVAAILATPDSLDASRAGSSTQVALVQGNVPRLGLDFNAQRRAVLDNHVRVTEALADKVRAGDAEQPDMVLWPENASDISPMANADAAQEITDASVSVGAPIVFGTLLADGPEGRPTNTVLVWDQQRGPVDRYDKHIIQPFGEYLPWRPFFRLFSSYADMAGNFRPGTGPSTVSVPGRTGTVDVGVSTCWEIAFDSSTRTAVEQGAQLLYVPTNNATFGRTDMTYQQLAMSQVRAVEHGRAVAVVATSGVSAVIGADGMIESESGFFTPAVLQSRMALHTNITPATRMGPWPQRAAVVVALMGFLFAVAGHTRFSQRLASRRFVGRRSSASPQRSKEIDGIRH